MDLKLMVNFTVGSSETLWQQWVAHPLMSSSLCFPFSGVSCDACLKGNFRGRRFKCLICYDYDLCASCYESGATTTRHTTEHPMQCILTRVDYGKPLSRETWASYWVHADLISLFLWLSRTDVFINVSFFFCRFVLWRRHLFGWTTSVVHMSLLW